MKITSHSPRLSIEVIETSPSLPTTSVVTSEAMTQREKALSLLGRGRTTLPPTVEKVGNVLAVRLGTAEAATRVAAIDLGSSSAKLLVLERTGSGAFKTLLDRKIGCALGKDVVAGGDISEANIQRATDALTTLAKDAEAFGVDIARIPVITTAVMRNSKNGGEVAKRIQAASGLLNIKVLSGDDEAQVGFMGALTLFAGKAGRYATLDLGGGSFQLAIGTETKLEDGGSTQIGSNYVMEKALQGKERLTSVDFSDADKTLSQVGPMPLDPSVLQGRTLVATGGISKFLRAHFGQDVIAAVDIDKLRHEMGALSWDERAPLIRAGKDSETQMALGVDSDKGARGYGAKLTASSTLLLHILRGLGVDSVFVSETDARHTLALRVE